MYICTFHMYMYMYMYMYMHEQYTITDMKPHAQGCDLAQRFVFDKGIEAELRDKFGPDELTLELVPPSLWGKLQKALAGS